MDQGFIYFVLLLFVVVISPLVLSVYLFGRWMKTRHESKLQGKIIYWNAVESGRYSPDSLKKLAETLSLSRKDIVSTETPNFYLNLILEKIISSEDQFHKEVLVDRLVSEYSKSGRKIKEIEDFFQNLTAQNLKRNLKASIFLLKKNLNAEKFKNVQKEMDDFIRIPDFLNYIRRKLKESEPTYSSFGYRM